MDITSLQYVLLAVCAIFLYYFIPVKLRVGYLVILSCGFVATYDLFVPLYLISFAVINYFIGLRLGRSDRSILIFKLGITLNLFQLVLLRYASFAIDPLFSAFNVNVQPSALNEIIVPIGISYYTLQSIGYLINIKMGWEKPEKNFMRFFLYIIYFPKFLSGPIERSNHFLSQLDSTITFNQKQVTEGLRLALYGFFKKVVIGDHLALIVNGAYSNIEIADEFSLAAIIILQPLYLYFDFSGYTDIAIGVSKAFGINLLNNFNRPFFSENMTVFWKRFHISLSSWFNDYVFRQVSFKYRRFGIYATVIGLLITWTLFGIWHGAGWNFMILGLLQAIAILFEFVTKKQRNKIFSRIPELPRRWISRFFTFLFYGFSLTFFFAPDLKTAFSLLGGICCINNDAAAFSLIAFRTLIFPVLFIAGILFLELLANDYPHHFNRLFGYWSGDGKYNKIFRLATYYVGLTLIFIFYETTQEFIYFQF